MSIKNNLKLTVLNILGATTSLVRVASELTLEVSNITVGSIDQVIPTTKELLKSPLSAYAGWLEEGGMTEAEAEAKAYAMLEGELSQAVKSGSKATGKLVAQMLEGWDDLEVEATKASK